MCGGAEGRARSSLIHAGSVHFAVVDLFPPAKRDPQGIHPLIWGEGRDGEFHFDPAKPLTCVSYIGGPMPEAFVEPIAEYKFEFRITTA